MNVNSFQDCKYVTPCQEMAKTRVYSRYVTFLIKVWNQTDRISRNSSLRYVALKLSVLHDMNYNALSQLLASVSAQLKEQA